MRFRPALLAASLAALALAEGGAGLAADAPFDVVIRGGTVYDGSGSPGARADVGIRGDKIEAVGDLSKAQAARSSTPRASRSRRGSSTCCPGRRTP
jgi:hypothetical protein